MIGANESHVFTCHYSFCWICMHGYSDTYPCVIAVGDTRGLIKKVIGEETNDEYSYNNGYVTIKNNVSWPESFFFFG